MGGSHYSVDTVSRGNDGGGNAVATASYQSGERLEDRVDFDEDGKRNYDVRDDDRPVLETGIVTPKNIDPADLDFDPHDREELWNQVEDREGRKDSVLARTITAELPAKLGAERCAELVEEYAEELSEGMNIAVDYALHPADEDNDNIHAHLQLTRRRLDPSHETGLGEKTKEFDAWTDPEEVPAPETGPDLIKSLRESYAEGVNHDLIESVDDPLLLEPDDFVDVRSLQDRFGIEDSRAEEIAEEYDLQGFHKTHAYNRPPGEERTVETVNGNEVTAEVQNERVDSAIRELGLEPERNPELPESYPSEDVRIVKLQERLGELEETTNRTEKTIRKREGAIESINDDLAELDELEKPLREYERGIKSLRNKSFTADLWDKFKTEIGMDSTRSRTSYWHQKVEEAKPDGEPAFQTADPEGLREALGDRRDRLVSSKKSKQQDLQRLGGKLEHLSSKKEKYQQTLNNALGQNQQIEDGLAEPLNIDEDLYELDPPTQDNTRTRTQHDPGGPTL